MTEFLIDNSSFKCIKAIIFDKDGTISNSEEYLLELARYRVFLAIEKFKLSKINNIKTWILKKLLVHIYGIKKNYLAANAILAIASRDQNIISTATIFSLFGFNWSQSLLLAQEIFDNVDNLLLNKKENKKKQRTLISGSLDFLVNLKKEKICIALMTNDTKSGVEEFISENNLEGIFAHIWSAEDKPSKPDPKAVIELCKKMNLHPSECALISDADTDLKMAKEADIKVVIGFTGGWEKPPILNEQKFLIQKFKEIKVQSNN